MKFTEEIIRELYDKIIKTRQIWYEENKLNISINNIDWIEIVKDYNVNGDIGFNLVVDGYDREDCSRTYVSMGDVMMNENELRQKYATAYQKKLDDKRQKEENEQRLREERAREKQEKIAMTEEEIKDIDEILKDNGLSERVITTLTNSKKILEEKLQKLK